MALSPYQVSVLRILAARRKAGGESYVVGGVAPNQVLETPRLSHDIDLFHDTTEALAHSWAEDRLALSSVGYAVDVIRESPSFVEALVAHKGECVLVQWARDSAYRFFPLIEDTQLGLTLHPLDLATNKALALVGRLEPRDWVDMLECHARLQPLGYLLWAACGKDPGYSPDFLVGSAARQRYAQPELDSLAFDGPSPSASTLGHSWKKAVGEAREIISALPSEKAGFCVLAQNGNPFSGSFDELRIAVDQNSLLFHPGQIGGVLPTIRQ